MTILLRIFSGLFGYDYATVMKQPTVSRQKIVTLGTLMLIPVGLWVFSGYYMARHLMGISMVGVILVALVLGGIILTVDRSFVATPKISRGGLLKITRLGFAIVSTVLGSLTLDLALFSGDLEEFRKGLAEDGKVEAILDYQEKHGGELARISGEKEKTQLKYDQLQASYLAEMDGSGGTGKFGVGKVAAAKEREKSGTATAVAKLEQAYEVERQSLDKLAKGHAEEKVSKRQDALLSQVKDLHHFILSDGFTIGFYVFFFVFVLMLELFFFLYKSAVADTIFEKWLEEEEEHGKQRLEAYRRQKAKLTKEDEVLGDDHGKVRRLISGESSRKVV